MNKATITADAPASSDAGVRRRMRYQPRMKSAAIAMFSAPPSKRLRIILFVSPAPELGRTRREESLANQMSKTPIVPNSTPNNHKVTAVIFQRNRECGRIRVAASTFQAGHRLYSLFCFTDEFQSCRRVQAARLRHSETLSYRPEWVRVCG